MDLSGYLQEDVGDILGQVLSLVAPLVPSVTGGLEYTIKGLSADGGDPIEILSCALLSGASGSTYSSQVAIYNAENAGLNAGN